MWMRTRHSRFVLAGVLVSALVWAGCGQLKKMKDAHQAERYADVAAMDVSCDPGKDGCNQMHLLKGDACYRLGVKAEMGEEAEPDSTIRRHFRCADTHLGTGIRQTEAKGAGQWKIAGSDRAQWYLNRAESLRQLRDLSTGDTARAVAERLLTFGRSYREALPDAAAPSFYVAKARYALLQPKLIDVSPGDAAVCDELTAIQNDLAEAPAEDAADGIRKNIEDLNRQLDLQRERAECPS